MTPEEEGALYELITSGDAKRIRLQADISLTKLAKKIDIPVSNLAKWEKNERYPRSRLYRQRYYRWLISVNRIEVLAVTVNGYAVPNWLVTILLVAMFLTILVSGLVVQWRRSEKELKGELDPLGA